MVRVGAALLALALVGAGCRSVGDTASESAGGSSGGTGLADQETPTSSDPGGDSNDDADDADDADDGESGSRSPLEEFMGITGPQSEADAVSLRLEVNESIKACMAAEGFEWQAAPVTINSSLGFDESYTPGTEEWAARYGLGFSTMAYPQEAVGPDLVGHTFDSDLGEVVDPNADYLASLSEADAEAFQTALYGPERFPDIDFEALSEEEINAAYDEFYADYEPSGCFPEAEEAVYDSNALAYYEEFEDQLDALTEQVKLDPRVQKNQQKVSECVAKEGIEGYVDGDQVRVDIEERLQVVNEIYYGKVGSLVPETMPEDARTALAEVQAYEVELGVILFRCTEGKSDEYLATYSEVYDEYEERFIEQNREALETFKAEQEQADS